MKASHLLAMTALLALAATGAGAQRLEVGGSWSPPPRHHGGHFPGHGRGFDGGFLAIDREVVYVIEKEAETEEKPAAVAPPPPPPPRKPYVIGDSYSSLPGGCMKLIEGGEAYYYCDGEWYRQLRAGRDAQYLAVARN